ncbi:helix-turn-helix domain-containing protein [Nonomuraea sp. SMC257]|uniref:Helix-turn-helix domain-containing protein n=1 Tax=Nonomuraea montanisoli TaxID=2741721 RepID=A0A7Y6IFB8_9ACTN|nr:Scr1 family TA system antitoxin-like transcriptional regulator [Nonomuraea montanisoli]NUW37041.1 helix-turn-helix domain-containing protein [Nonomuraea montanisoli]
MDQRGPVIQGALLRRRLAELRRQRDLTQDEVAKALGWHTSKVIRIEGGRTGVTKVDLDALLRLYRTADSAVAEELHQLNKGARTKAWWNDFKNDVSDAYLSYVGFEAGASVIRQFQPLAVPGLLQTRAYAETIAHTRTDRATHERVVQLRLLRQEMLRQRENAPREIFVLDEAVIRRRVGIRVDRSIMPDQLRHMVAVAQEGEHVSIRVVPFEAGSHVGMIRGSFTLLEFGDGLGEVLHRENSDLHETLIGGDSLISEVRTDFEAILEESLSPSDSLSLITRAADEMR